MSYNTTKMIVLGRSRILPQLQQRWGFPSSSSTTVAAASFSFSSSASSQASSQASASASASASIASKPSPLLLTPTTWVTTELLPEDERIAVIRMNRKPANALSMEMCAELSNAIKALEEDSIIHKNTSAMVLSSSLDGNNIFSAGLDIGKELYKPDLDRLPKFWWNVQQLFLDLYGCTQLTTVAALGGHAPAAGCMVALSCDYRVMLHHTTVNYNTHNDRDHNNHHHSHHVFTTMRKNGKIGLNECHLGIVAPPWMCQQYIDVLGHRKAELALLSGTLFSPLKALENGLVDELVDIVVDVDVDIITDDDTATATGEKKNDTADDNSSSSSSSIEQAAIKKAKEFVRIPADARAAVKKLTRRPLIDTYLTNTDDRERDIESFCSFVTSDPVQLAIGDYLEALSSSSKSKSSKDDE